MRRLVIILAAAWTGGAAGGESLDAILARMDRTAKEFKSLSAKTKRIDFTAVLNESSESTGEVRMKRGKGGVAGVMEFGEPDPRKIQLYGHTAKIYYPKANTVEIYDTGKYAGAKDIDRFVLLGFGTSGAELKKDYAVKEIGPEKLDSLSTTRIELTPHSRELQKMVTKIELWIPEGKSNPVQEKVFKPSKDYLLIKYSDLVVNPPLPDSAFQLKLPAGVKEIHPQH